MEGSIYWTKSCRAKEVPASDLGIFKGGGIQRLLCMLFCKHEVTASWSATWYIVYIIVAPGPGY